MDDKNRARAGIFVSAAGIIINLILSAAKISAGIMFGIVSVTADGFNNLSDCGSGAASLISFHISLKPADKEHPYGHRRAEYIASMIIGFLVLFVGFELLRESIAKISDKSFISAEDTVFIILSVSVAAKAALFVFYRIQAKRLQSDALRAAATDSACDCLATLAVIAGVLVTRFYKLPADGWVGLLVALFILWQGYAILKEAGSKLLGQAPDNGLVNSLRDKLLKGANVLGIHDLRIYNFGRGAYVATVHIEMSASVPAIEAHAVLDGLEHEIGKEFGVSLTAHLDPVDLSDSEAMELEQKAREAVKDMIDGIELHDFRLVRGINKKLIFEAGVPFSCPHTDKELAERICAAVREACGCEPVLTLERE